MYRPPYYISRPTRIAIMLALIAVFFVLSPLLILYAAGFRYDSETRTILTTGVLSVDVRPRQNTRVFIDDIQIFDRMPIRQTSLAPNTSYKVRIESDGFFPFEKDVLVEPNQTGYVNDIHLLLKDDNSQHLILSKNKPTWLSSYGPHLATLEKGSIVITQLTTGQSQTLNLDENEYVTHVLFSPDGSSFFVLSIKAGKRHVIYARINNADRHQRASFTSIANISRPVLSNALFAEDKGQIMRLSDSGFGPIQGSSSTDWIVDADDTIWNQDGSVLSRGNEIIELSHIPTVLHKVTNAHIISQSYNALYITDRKTKEASRLNVTNVRPIDNNRYLAWSEWEIWMIDEAESALINRTGHRLKDVILADEYGALLLVYTDHVDMFYPNYFVDQELFQLDDIESTTVDIDEGLLFVVGSSDGARALHTIRYRAR